jgi:hypothetical protein
MTGHNRNVRMQSWNPDDAFRHLQERRFMFGADEGLIEVRRDGGEAILIYKWSPVPYRFGIRIDLTPHPLEADLDVQEWSDSLSLWLTEDVIDGGYVDRASRRRADGFIELTNPTWPQNTEAFIRRIDRRDDDVAIVSRRVSNSGIDSSHGLAALQQGSDAAWFVAAPDPETGRVFGQSIMVLEEPSVARLTHLSTVPGSSRSLVVDLIRCATHAAAARGALCVVTDIDVPEMKLTGFRRDGTGLGVTTDFLDEDHAGAVALFQSEVRD